jgi:hypothetical protein
MGSHSLPPLGPPGSHSLPPWGLVGSRSLPPLGPPGSHSLPPWGLVGSRSLPPWGSPGSRPLPRRGLRVMAPYPLVGLRVVAFYLAWARGFLDPRGRSCPSTAHRLNISWLVLSESLQVCGVVVRRCLLRLKY